MSLRETRGKSTVVLGTQPQPTVLQFTPPPPFRYEEVVSRVKSLSVQWALNLGRSLLVLVLKKVRFLDGWLKKFDWPVNLLTC
jgi:hypothetical protein